MQRTNAGTVTHESPRSDSLECYLKPICTCVLCFQRMQICSVCVCVFYIFIICYYTKVLTSFSFELNETRPPSVHSIFLSLRQDILHSSYWELSNSVKPIFRTPFTVLHNKKLSSIFFRFSYEKGVVSNSHAHFRIRVLSVGFFVGFIIFKPVGLFINYYIIFISR